MWNLRDKNGKFRSRRAFKQDMRQQSQEPWEKRRNSNEIIDLNLDFIVALK